MKIAVVRQHRLGADRRGPLRETASVWPINRRMISADVYYNVVVAAQAVRNSGLPPHFAALLETGGLVPTPSLEGISS